MTLEKVATFGVGLLVGYYILVHYGKTRQAA